MDAEAPATPRWVKVFALVALVVLVILVAVLVFGGGRHGPDRHTSEGWSAAVVEPDDGGGRGGAGNGEADRPAPSRSWRPDGRGQGAPAPHGPSGGQAR